MSPEWDEDLDEPHPEALGLAPPRTGAGSSLPPVHDHERRVREFRILSGPEAKRRARRRLVEFLIEHPGVVPVLRERRD